MKNHINKIGVSILVSLLFSLALVSASGVSAEYWKKPENKPMYLMPGEAKATNFTLQNMVGEDDLTFTVKIINGSEIAQLVDGPAMLYSVPHGTKDVPVGVLVTAPANAKAGDQFNVGLSFTTTAPQNSGEFRMGSAFDMFFDVVILESPKPAPVENAPATASTPWKIYGIIIACLIVIVLIILIIFKKRQAHT